MSDTAPVTFTRDGGIAHVRLRRPDTMNVIDQAMAKSLADVFESLHDEPALKVVTLRGDGKSFMAGGDLRPLQTTAEKRLQLLDVLIGDFHRAVRAIRRLPAPVLCGVHGAAAGAGMSLALACDLVIADERARFVPAYSRIGATPDGGLSWLLTKAIGRHRASDVLMLGEPLKAADAYALGLVNRIVPSDAFGQTIDELAERLANGSLTSIAAIKALVGEAETGTFEAHLDNEHAAYRKAVAARDFETGVNAFFNGALPKFD